MRRSDSDVVAWQQPLVRIFKTSGAHALPWNELRSFGPLSLCRWDPMPEPAREYPQHGVMYAASTLATALAEVGQATRTIDIHTGQPAYLIWQPTRPLRLLDLTGRWLIRHQAATALMHGERATCRAWARAIHGQWPDLDGILTNSTMTNDHAVTLFNPARDSFPARPTRTGRLDLPILTALIDAISTEIGYSVPRVPPI
ncbi:RES domain-containing protein [Enemella evansiae]|uniref:RES domain-containing protein n=1 Tax=Enemella evansiae TaxID=2016499 RepID=UPI001E5426E2|nr:RES domain-containing protein [Enemella evansiae]